MGYSDQQFIVMMIPRTTTGRFAMADLALHEGTQA